MRLDPHDLDLLAQRIAEHLAAQHPAAPRLLDAAQLAAALGVRRDWIYAHASQLGAIRLGGPHGRLRFDLARATSALLPQSDRAAAAGTSCALDPSQPWSYRRRDRRAVGRAARQRPRP